MPREARRGGRFLNRPYAKTHDTIEYVGEDIILPHAMRTDRV